jgi:hypothetical protein
MGTIRTIHISAERLHPLGLPFRHLFKRYFTLIRCLLASVAAA